MLRQVIWFFIVALKITLSVTAFPEQQLAEIKPALGPTASSCASASGVSAEQIQLAKEGKDINRISACFFTCLLNNSGLIIENSDKKTLNVPAILVFAKYYIPSITLMNIFSIAAEVIACTTEFENEPKADDLPFCPKTRVFVNCIVEQKTLIEALWLATQS